MSILDQIVAVYRHLPPEDRLAAAQADLLEMIAAGQIIAFPEGSDVRYRHVKHCTKDQFENRLTADEVKQRQEQTRRWVNRDWN